MPMYAKFILIVLGMIAVLGYAWIQSPDEVVPVKTAETTQTLKDIKVNGDLNGGINITGETHN